MKKSLLTLVFVAITALSVSAQYRCGTDVMNNRYRSRNPFLAQSQDNYNRLMQEEMIEWRTNRDGDTDAVLVIPVVFHILHMDGSENISDEQIYNQMEILNRDYNRMNADTIIVVNGFDTIIANVKLEFRLATKDFLGNCTNGIERIRTIETFVGDNGSKLNQWPRDRYVNIWTVASMENGVAGYSQYPSSVIDGQLALADGVIILHDYIGDIGTGNPGRSRALTHEIGHYLDLAHPWGSTNEPEVECGDDGVLDTPVTEGHASCSDLRDFSCSSVAIAGATYRFSGVSAGITGTTDPTSLPMILLGEEDFTRLELGQFTSNGVSLNPSVDGEFGYRGWDDGGVQGATAFNQMTGSLNTGKYYEFTVTPRPGSAMTLTNLKFTANRSESGPRNFCVRSSVNNFATNLTAVGSNSNLAVLATPNPVNTYFFANDTAIAVTTPQVNLTGASYSAMINPVTFRIYAYNAEDAVGTFSVDSLMINGTYGIVENVQNFMDYSYCSHMFTEGQKSRMRLALFSQLSGRNNLWSETNRALTGTDENALVCAPVADFYPVKKFACVNEGIDFRDNSTNGVVESYSWTFQDGAPSTSTSANPSIVFTSEGRKSVTLTVTNAQGSTTKTINQCVVIAPSWSEVAGGPLFQDDFDSSNDFQNYYVPLNHDQNISIWQQTNLAGFSNSTSAYLNAFDMAVSNIDEGGNDIDELVTPSCDLSMVSGASVSFKYAYATQATTLADITDLFQVYISNNCGETWATTPRVSLQGLELVTSGSVSIPYYPASSSDWREESFTVPSTYMNDGFRMKFVFKASLFPNNLFIDDINMTGIVGVEELDADFFGAMVYPNPADESTVLSYVDRGSESLTIALTDLSGRVVETWTPRSSAPGPQRLTIDTNKLSTGAYLITMNSSTHSKTLKLLVD